MRSFFFVSLLLIVGFVSTNVCADDDLYEYELAKPAGGWTYYHGWYLPPAIGRYSSQGAALGAVKEYTKWRDWCGTGERISGYSSEIFRSGGYRVIPEMLYDYVSVQSADVTMSGHKRSCDYPIAPGDSFGAGVITRALPYVCPEGSFKDLQKFSDTGQPWCKKPIKYFIDPLDFNSFDCEQDGNPCNPLTGNKKQVETDYSSGSTQLDFQRVFNSNQLFRSSGSLGHGWRHSFDFRLFGSDISKEHIEIDRVNIHFKSSEEYRTKAQACGLGWAEIKSRWKGVFSHASAQYNAVSELCDIYMDGRLVDSVPVNKSSGIKLENTAVSAIRPDGTYFRFTKKAGSQEIESRDSGLTLTAMEDGYVLQTADGQIEKYDDQGKVTEIRYVGGRIHYFHYSIPSDQGGDGNGDTLDRVVDHFNNYLSFHYENGVLDEVVTPDGVVKFDYADQNLVSVIYPDESIRQYLYEDEDFPSHLSGIVDANGKRYVSWEYDDDGKATVSRYADGVNETRFSYNINTTTVRNALGKEHVYRFSANAKTFKTYEIEGEPCLSCPNGDQPKRTYDANGFLSSTEDWNGNTTKYINNIRGLAESITEAVGSVHEVTTNIQWHEQFALPLRIETSDLIISNEYDDVGRLLKTIRTDKTTDEQRIQTFVYNAQGLLTRVDGLRTDVNDVTVFEYDEQGNLTKTTNALGQETLILEHDASGRPKRIQDANSQITLLNYDLRGRITSINYAGAQTQFSYDAVGQLVKTTLPNGVELSHEYDAAYRRTKTTDAQGNSVKYEYDLMGNVRFQRTEDASGVLKNSLEQTYYKTGWLEKVIGASNQQSRTLLRDDMGNVLSDTNPLQHQTTQVFDELNRLKEVKDALDGTTTYEYNQQDQLVSVTAPNGAETTYEYNGFGERIKRTSSDTGITVYTYDEAGNTKTETDARGITVTYVYDVLNRVTQALASDGQQMTYSYDEGENGIGRLSRVIDNIGETRYQYDIRGNRIVETRLQDGQETTIGYSYNLADQLETMTYPSGHAVNYGRDTNGKVNAITVSKDGETKTLLSNATYLPFGDISEFDWGNGQQYRATHDADYRLTGQTTTGLEARAYQYDDADNLKQLTAAATDRSYDYDELERLQQEQTLAGPAIHYSYDANSNRLQALLEGGVSDDYAYQSSSNVLTAISGGQSEVLAHDDAGNLIQDGRFQYNYDAFGRLVHVEGQGQSIDYVYNARHQRVRKTVNGTITYFQYDDSGRLLVEQDAQGKVVREYIYLGLQPVGLLLAGEGETTATTTTRTVYRDAVFRANRDVFILTDRTGNKLRIKVRPDKRNKLVLRYADGSRDVLEPNTRFVYKPNKQRLHFRHDVELDDGSTRIIWGRIGAASGKPDRVVIKEVTPGGEVAETELYHLHSDQLATVHAITDANQTVVWKGEHDAFGKTTVTINQIDNPLRFPGQYYDDETGLHYNWHRYYNPATGRYISSDPIGLVGGLNTFGYAGQSPLGRYDADGLFWESVSPAAYHEVGQFVDWALNHANNDIRGQGGWQSSVWDAIAADGLEALSLIDRSCYAAAVLAATKAVIKPAKALDTATKGGLNANPFKGKSFQEIDEILTGRGFKKFGSDPASGKGSYFHPKSGRKYYLDKGGEYREGTELPHVDVHRMRDGANLEKEGKRRYPLGDKLLEPK